MSAADSLPLEKSAACLDIREPGRSCSARTAPPSDLNLGGSSNPRFARQSAPATHCAKSYGAQHDVRLMTGLHVPLNRLGINTQLNSAMRKFSQITLVGAVAGIILAASPLCYADFALTPYLGDMYRAGAGRSAAADDASTVFNNPAGMDQLDGRQLMLDSQLYLSSSTFSNNGSTDVTGAPLTGGNGGDAGTNTLLPGLYYTNRLNSAWAFGVSVNVPFGLSTQWDQAWVGRYQAIRTGIETLNINPAVSYRINDAWSVGAGVSAQYAKAKLSSAIDFGVLCLAVQAPATCASLGLPGPQSADGLIDLKGDDWGYGFNLGALYARDKIRFGVSYRSSIDYTLTGDAKFTNPPQAAAFAPAFTNTKARVPLTLPDVASAGLYYQASDSLAVMTDLTWTRWSRFNELKVEFDNPAQPTQVYRRDWHDTWRFALGFDYTLNPKWRLQWGAAYADSAIPDSTFDPSIPTSNAYWLTVGARYAYSKSLGFGFGVNHIIFTSRSIDHTGAFGDTLRGTVDSHLDVLGGQILWRL